MTRTTDLQNRIWDDTWFRKRTIPGKLLFLYLMSNQHKELSGIYEISLDRIAFETTISIEDLPDAIQNLWPKVKWDAEHELVWVVNFVYHQFMRGERPSPSIIQGIRKSIRGLNKPDHDFVKAFCGKYPGIIGPKELSMEKVESEFKIEENEQEKKAYANGKPKNYKDNSYFMKFWSEYPRKDGGPKTAYRKWPYPMEDGLFDKIMKGLEAYTQCEQWINYIDPNDGRDRRPMAHTWLNQERWEGDVEKLGPIKKSTASNVLPSKPGKYAGVGERVNTDG